jgi:hypothetical protein
MAWPFYETSPTLNESAHRRTHLRANCRSTVFPPLTTDRHEESAFEALLVVSKGQLKFNEENALFSATTLVNRTGSPIKYFLKRNRK